ncbi:MAG: ATP-binding cassette domain-containing protein, partial [Anaerolineaceae bacterium]|nr:ATP-binding cassette domain-containing protein [Anaerolineaceae bacterium]
MELMLEDLYQSYSKTPVLCGLSETFTEGKIYSIIGRNGAGKTTLFNCISGNLRYKSGKILLTDQGVLRPIEFKDVGMVSASPMLPEYLTGYEFIHYFLKMRADSEIQSEKENYFFDLVKISNKDRHNLIKNYSYG